MICYDIYFDLCYIIPLLIINMIIIFKNFHFNEKNLKWNFLEKISFYKKNYFIIDWFRYIDWYFTYYTYNNTKLHFNITYY